VRLNRLFGFDHGAGRTGDRLSTWRTASCRSGRRPRGLQRTRERPDPLGFLQDAELRRAFRDGVEVTDTPALDAARVIVAEVGLDMGRFPSHAYAGRFSPYGHAGGAGHRPGAALGCVGLHRACRRRHGERDAEGGRGKTCGAVRRHSFPPPATAGDPARCGYAPLRGTGGLGSARKRWQSFILAGSVGTGRRIRCR
jgi:hypothetical protein